MTKREFETFLKAIIERNSKELEKIREENKKFNEKIDRILTML